MAIMVQKQHIIIRLHGSFFIFDLRHGQGCRSLSSLCLNNFCPTLLCPLGESLDVFTRQCISRRSCLLKMSFLQSSYRSKVWQHKCTIQLRHSYEAEIQTYVIFTFLFIVC
jgi:hypothetical protein